MAVRLPMFKIALKCQRKAIQIINDSAMDATKKFHVKNCKPLKEVFAPLNSFRSVFIPCTIPSYLSAPFALDFYSSLLIPLVIHQGDLSACIKVTVVFKLEL